MKTQRDVASFVLRMTQDLWKDGEGDPKVQWRGHIEHVQSHAELSFTDFADAIAFIQKHTTQVTMDSVAGEDSGMKAKAMRESLGMWQKFASNYSNIVMEAWENTARQNDRNLQMLMNAWRLPFARGESAAEKPSPETDALKAKIAELEKELAAQKTKSNQSKISLAKTQRRKAKA